MKIRKFSATYVYTGKGAPLKNGIVELDEKGTVVSVIDTGGQLAEFSNMEFHSGVIVPGFVNTHCHLELSNLRGKITPKQGLVDFVGQVVGKRSSFQQNAQRAMRAADADMHAQGVVAVGDIANCTASIDVKTKSKIHYHTFVETFGLDEEKATEIFDRHWHMKVAFMEKELSVSLTPHSPYSLSPKLFDQLTDFFKSAPEPISFHNQETPSENEWFLNGDGELYNSLKSKGFPVDSIKATGKSSLRSTLERFPSQNNLLLIHNTFTQEQDLDYALQKHGNIYFVFCPNANLFIENRLPDVHLFRKKNASITLGTDSLASNEQLSVMEEMITLRENFPEIPFGEMLQWATINGAKALQLDKNLGTIEKGKRPGLVLIQGFDYENMHINDESFSRRLV